MPSDPVSDVPDLMQRGALPGDTTAADIPYAPAVPGNWTTPPAEVAQALDEIAAGGAGGGGSGTPLAAAFFDATGKLSSDPSYLADRLDAFQRPAVRDFRLGPGGRGAVSKLGAWGVDGDPENVTSEGFVTYGPNALGNGPDAAQGGLGFYEPNGFGSLTIIPGVNGGNPFYTGGFEDGGPAAPFGLTGLVVNDDNALSQFFVERLTGRIQIGNPDPTHGGIATLYLNQVGPLPLPPGVPSGSPVQMAYASKSMAIRLSQYGNGLRTSNIGFFRSRGAAIGTPDNTPGATCLDNDSLMNLTCSGVTQNGDVPIAGVFDCWIPPGGVIPLPLPGGRSISPNFRWQLARDTINSRRLVWNMEGLSGDFVMGWGNTPPVPLPPAPAHEARIRVRDAQASANASPNAMMGSAVLDAAGSALIPNTLVTANTHIAIFWAGGGPVPVGDLWPPARIPGTSFTIASTAGAGAVGCLVWWQLWEPAP